jgi:hypothetical protein
VSPTPETRSPEASGWLMRDDEAKDEVPFLRERQRNDRLDVEGVLRAVVGPDAEVEVALERDADEAPDRVLKLLGERGGVLLRARRL